MRVCAGIVGVFAIVLIAYAGIAQDDRNARSTPPARAVERTRDTVKMLDDIYKTAVVLITDKYVHTEDDFPAGSAAVALFDAIDKKGWHTAQLLDVTGDPYDSENVADDEFEKQAVAKIKNGEKFVEQVEKDAEGKFVLRAMTPVPVVMAKCVLCHPHYQDVPEGAAIGAISYSVPIR
ncbi:MAG: DUF3365 domain-containing protein [Planctomycetales bacterium]|nr:DUF3365 domain-containing protein [Planctomycetales bacterium]